MATSLNALLKPDFEWLYAMPSCECPWIYLEGSLLTSDCGQLNDADTPKDIEDGNLWVVAYLAKETLQVWLY